jgi:hypothetical protein
VAQESAAHETVLCPSGPATGAHATLLGVFGRDGRLVYTPGTPGVSPTLLSALTGDGESAEARARFAGRCASSACAYWAEGSCHAIDLAHEALDGQLPDRAEGGLPECGIRPACRWWQQEGPSACGLCPYVATAPLATTA